MRAVCSGLICLLLSCTTLAQKPSIGDPTFPTLGNTGYKASHYDIRVDYDPKSNDFSGQVTMTATADQPLADFTLDFEGFEIAKVELDGKPVPFERSPGKLKIEPVAPLASGATFRLRTVYAGQPKQQPSDALNGLTAGWIHYQSGSVAVCEPNLAHTWFPCNDHPLDKATFDVEVKTPPGYSVISNGTEQPPASNGDPYKHFREDKPTLTCMVTIAIGKYDTYSQVGPSGLPIRNYVPVGASSLHQKAAAADPSFLSFLSARLGPYPFDTYGVLFLPQNVSSVNQLMIGSALETTTVPIFGPEATGPSDLIHEMCHQWMGDCVSVTNWGDDIWWVEGFARYSESLRLELASGKPAYLKEMNDLYKQEASRDEWLKPGHLSAEEMFSERSYIGGALVFHALRLKIGDELFFKTIRTFIERHKYGNAATSDLIAVASEVSGQDLQPFFKTWLFGDKIPELPSQRPSVSLYLSANF